MCSWPSRNDEDQIVRMSVLLRAALSVAITQARLLTNVHMYPLFATHSKGDLLLLGNLVLQQERELAAPENMPWLPQSLAPLPPLAPPRPSTQRRSLASSLKRLAREFKLELEFGRAGCVVEHLRLRRDYRHTQGSNG